MGDRALHVPGSEVTGDQVVEEWETIPSPSPTESGSIGPARDSFPVDLDFSFQQLCAFSLAFPPQGGEGLSAATDIWAPQHALFC